MGPRGKALLALLLCTCLFVELNAQLEVGYYKKKCPKAEYIVRKVVKKALEYDNGLGATFVRMQFHDCFVRGCDASILLDSTPTNTAEKDSPINNPSIEGYDVIDKIKSKIEAKCKGVVSCADIITFATRESVYLAGGLFYEVPSGRKDGKVSKASETFENLPPPTLNLSNLTSSFAKKGLTQEDLIILSGAHTFGKSNCTAFASRLHNFSEEVKTDPSLDPSFAKKLKKVCPAGATTTTKLDHITPDKFDSQYYKNILSHRVLFTSDQTLLSTSKAAKQVEKYASDNTLFNKDFAEAMVKMSKIDVLTGKEGEVRLDCRVVN